MRFTEHDVGLDYKVFVFETDIISDGFFVVMAHLVTSLTSKKINDIVNSMLSSNAVDVVIAYANRLVVCKHSDVDWSIVMCYIVNLLSNVNLLGNLVSNACYCLHCMSRMNKAVLVVEGSSNVF